MALPQTSSKPTAAPRRTLADPETQCIPPGDNTTTPILIASQQAPHRWVRHHPVWRHSTSASACTTAADAESDSTALHDTPAEPSHWNSQTTTWAAEALERIQQLTIEQQHQLHKRLHYGFTDLSVVDAEAFGDRSAANHAAQFARRHPTGPGPPPDWVRSFDKFAIQAQLARVGPAKGDILEVINEAWRQLTLPEAYDDM